MIPILVLGVFMVGLVLSTEQATRHVVGQLTQQFPVYQRQISRVLVRIVEVRAASGLLGTAVLVVFSTPLFGASRLVLHRLLGVKPAGGVVRNFFIHFIRDALLAVLLSVLLFIATTMSWVYHGLQALALNAMMPVPPQWFDYASFGLSLALSALMFYLAYRLVPRQRPGVGAALSGAMLASLLWEAAKQLFRLYVQEFGVYDEIYGPLGVVNDYGGTEAGAGGGHAPADEVVGAIKQTGGQAVGNYDSVASMAGGQAIIKTALDAFGRIDIVVNNAGILRDRMIFNMTEEEWDAVINTHLKEIGRAHV